MKGGLVQQVTAIIINYHQERLTERAVASVLASEGVGVRVVLVDNASGGVWARTTYGNQSQIELVINPANIGFGAACNQGIERALARGADFVFLLNNDATVEPDTLARLAVAAARTGLAAPKIHLADGRLYSAGGMVELRRARCRNRGITEPDRGQYDETAQIPFASACALLIARRALEGAQDAVRFYEPYFLYYEDADFCLRLARRGWRVSYVPAARALHLESASTPPERAAYLTYYNTRNRLIFLRRQGTLFDKLAGAPYLAGVTMVKMARDLWNGRRGLAHGAWRGLLDGLTGRLGPWREDGLTRAGTNRAAPVSMKK